jgi:hypothetical protein
MEPGWYYVTLTYGTQGFFRYKKHDGCTYIHPLDTKPVNHSFDTFYSEYFKVSMTKMET